MAISIESIEILKNYVRGVQTHDTKRGSGAKGVALALIGAILWRDTGDIALRGENDTNTNVIWFWIEQQRYALIYNHTKSLIELRLDSQNGDRLAEFDNTNSYQEILEIFKTL